MTKPMITIHNVETGEVVEREMNKEEYDLHQVMIIGYQKDKEAAEAAAAEKAAAKASALAKLAALGLSANEIAAL
jgi:hypothetical protein